MKTTSRPLRVEIDTQSHDGRGVGRVNGKVAFVAGALPGETVEAVLDRSHRRYDDYRLRSVLVAAADRIEPPCPLVGRCGGCDLQHQTAAAQLDHKTRVVLDLLRRHGDIVPGELDEPIASAPFGYRRRARLAVSVGRGGVRIGFREAAGRGVVGVDRCPVLAPPLQTLPGRLQAAAAALRRPRDLGHVELGLSESRDGMTQPVIHVHVPGSLDAGDRDVLAQLARSAAAYLSIGHPGGGVEDVHRPVPEDPGYRLPEFDLRIGFGPGDFLQGNSGVNRLLVGRLCDWLAESQQRYLLDAFAGAGNLSLALARRGFRVLGLEGSAAMVERGRANARANGLEAVVFELRDLAAAAPLDGVAALDVAVLDPPRAGAPALIEALTARKVPRIAYVSCSPATFARDAAALVAGGYRLARLCLVDMFPQTSHIELLAAFDFRGRLQKQPRGRG